MSPENKVSVIGTPSHLIIKVMAKACRVQIVHHLLDDSLVVLRDIRVKKEFDKSLFKEDGGHGGGLGTQRPVDLVQDSLDLGA